MGTFEDNCLQVRYVPLVRHSSDATTAITSTTTSETTENVLSAAGDSGLTWPSSPFQANHLSSGTEIDGAVVKRIVHDVSVAYICKLKPRPGKMDISKVTELGMHASNHFELA